MESQTLLSALINLHSTLFNFFHLDSWKYFQLQEKKKKNETAWKGLKQRWPFQQIMNFNSNEKLMLTAENWRWESVHSQSTEAIEIIEAIEAMPEEIRSADSMTSFKSL